MKDNSITINQQKTIFDGWKSISISLYMSLAGYAVLVGVPVISTAWVNLLGFSEIEVGRVAGADLGGLSAGALVAAMLIAKINRRLLIIISALTAMLANGLCIFIVDYENVLWLRLIAGFGSGIYTAVAVATLGATSNPARAFNMMLFFFAFSQGLEMYFLPKLSMSGIYIVFIFTYAISLIFIKWLPPHPITKNQDNNKNTVQDSSSDKITKHKIPTYVPWLVILAIVATYTNIGAYWTYIEIASANSEFSIANQELVSWVLTAASFFSLVGCLFATLLSNRFGLARPLLITLIIHASIVAMLANGITDLKIILSVFMFNTLWIFIDVYQMSTIANVDKTGRFASLLPAAQGLGQIIGPNLAASILAAGLGYSGLFIMCACASLTGMLIYAFMYIRLRKTIPSLADAS